MRKLILPPSQKLTCTQTVKVIRIVVVAKREATPMHQVTLTPTLTAAIVSSRSVLFFSH